MRKFIISAKKLVQKFPKSAFWPKGVRRLFEEISATNARWRRYFPCVQSVVENVRFYALKRTLSASEMVFDCISIIRTIL